AAACHLLFLSHIGPAAGKLPRNGPTCPKSCGFHRESGPWRQAAAARRPSAMLAEPGGGRHFRLVVSRLVFRLCEAFLPVLRSLTALALAALCALAPARADEVRAAATYSVTLGGPQVATAEIRLNDPGKAYAMPLYA